MKQIYYIWLSGLLKCLQAKLNHDLFPKWNLHDCEYLQLKLAGNDSGFEPLNLILHKYVTNNSLSTNWWHSGACCSWDTANGHSLIQWLWGRTLQILWRQTFSREYIKLFLCMTTGWLKIHLTAATVDARVHQLSTRPYVPAQHLLSENLIEQSVSRRKGKWHCLCAV